MKVLRINNLLICFLLFLTMFQIFLVIPRTFLIRFVLSQFLLMMVRHFITCIIKYISTTNLVRELAPLHPTILPILLRLLQTMKERYYSSVNKNYWQKKGTGQRRPRCPSLNRGHLLPTKKSTMENKIVLSLIYLRVTILMWQLVENCE